MPSSATRIVLQQHVTDDDVQHVAWDLEVSTMSSAASTGSLTRRAASTYLTR